MDQIVSLLLVAVGLSMDAFAVSICKGLSAPSRSVKNGLKTALYFGGFQALMPLLGYFLGNAVSTLIERVDHWIAFVLLVVIGIHMICEALGEEERQNASFQANVMLPLALATSIDALVVGITLDTFLEIPILISVTVIGVITGALSFLGIYVGQKVGGHWKTRAEIVGGAVLIFLGCKVLWEHLEIGALLFG